MRSTSHRPRSLNWTRENPPTMTATIQESTTPAHTQVTRTRLCPFNLVYGNRFEWLHCQREIGLSPLGTPILIVMALYLYGQTLK